MYRKFFAVFYYLTILCRVVWAIEVQEHWVQVEPSIKLRVVRMVSGAKPSDAAPTPMKKVVLYLPGRSSFFEKNHDFLQILSGETRFLDTSLSVANPLPPHEYDIWVIDLRGHGKSDGRLGMPCTQRCHIDAFDIYLKDIHTVLTQLVLPAYHTKPQVTLIGDSMGGVLALRYAQLYPTAIHQLVLISPMLKFNTAPFPEWLAKIIVAGACAMGASEQYAFGYGPLDFSKSDFAKFNGHHNEAAFHATNQFLQANQHMITAGPTFGWVKAAFDACALSMAPDELKKLACPLTVYAAGADGVVDNSVLSLINTVHPSTEVVIIQGAWHNLMKESDEYRVPFLSQLTELLSNSKPLEGQ